MLRLLYFRLKYLRIIIRKGTTDFKVFEQIFLFREYDFDFGKNINLIIDCGANVGYATLFFKARYPDSKIIAIEPEIFNFNVLKRNVADLNNVICLNKAIWFRNCKMAIENKNANNWSFAFVPDSEGEITTITIQELLIEYSLKKIDILKIDIEGAEFDIFTASSLDWLDHVSILIIETHDHIKQGASKAVFNALKDFSYKHYRLGENDIFIKEIKN